MGYHNIGWGCCEIACHIDREGHNTARTLWLVLGAPPHRKWLPPKKQLLWKLIQSNLEKWNFGPWKTLEETLNFVAERGWEPWHWYSQCNILLLILNEKKIVLVSLCNRTLFHVIIIDTLFKLYSDVYCGTWSKKCYFMEQRTTDRLTFSHNLHVTLN